MEGQFIKDYIKEVVINMPEDWLTLTTHRLDIYNESQAKTEFIGAFNHLFDIKDGSKNSLSALPTAYDYIRLGHPLSSILEWMIARFNNLLPEQVICFSSQTMPILAILRSNHLNNVRTRIVHQDALPSNLDLKTLRDIYGYQFNVFHIKNPTELEDFDGSTIWVHNSEDLLDISTESSVDFHIQISRTLGSLISINGERNKKYISEIQHVRRRESIAMTPANCLVAIKNFIDQSPIDLPSKRSSNLTSLQQLIAEITGSNIPPVIGSSGLSIQYAISMGIIHDAMENHPNSAIKLVIPPNCYGGTNDQARRVAACLDKVEVLDLPVDGDADMVKSIDLILDTIALEGAVPVIIVEIPTNPRVEVPDLNQLQYVLEKKRHDKNGNLAIDPIFVLDQTFCPNVKFLGDEDSLSAIRTISYVSGSKFPSGGKCTAGYCLSNEKAKGLMPRIAQHLQLCDNEATDLQIEILTKQMPSMLQRIQEAYINTREFVNFIERELPEAKINFVSEQLATKGFTPSVFSLDLPTKGNSVQERENYKRSLNLKLINAMITKIPKESKYCVSYGQLHGCYWTIPATSTQGTTKEEDKDYIARIACSPKMDIELHKKVFADFISHNAV